MKTRQTDGKKSDLQSVQLQVSANLLEGERGVEKPRGVAYAFSSGGKLLAQQPLDEKGQATLSLPTKRSAQRVRVLVGPDLGEREVNIQDLTRLGAVDRFTRIDADLLNPRADFTIAPSQWLCWLLGLCFVNGKLQKTHFIGGEANHQPVTGAIIEVYEVDSWPILVDRIPDYVLDGLRERLVNPLPDPIPDPPFRGIPTVNLAADRLARVGFDPQPEPPAFAVGSRFDRVALNPQPLPPKELFNGNALMFNPQPDPPAISADLRFRLANASRLDLRQIFVAEELVIRPLFCLLYPQLVTMQLVATTTTDECGEFSTYFSMGCSSDKPDLYFKAKQPWPPFGTFTIYAPTPIACHTYWNYQSGTEVNLYTSSPFAQTAIPCQPVIAPNNWVLFMAVGNYPIQLVEQDSTQTNFGLATEARSGAHVGSPFGGLLRFRMDFDNSLREDLGVKYYRVSYRKAGTVDWLPLTIEIHRHYSHEVGTDLVLEAYNLGPKVVGTTANLFEIPPSQPPGGADSKWVTPDLYEDQTSAKFPSAELAPTAEDGKYEFKLDLFDETGAAVDIVAQGIQYRIPDTNDFSGTIPTANAGSLVVGNSMIVTLHIDNNACSAELAAPTLDGLAAGDDCGVLDYDPDAPGTVTMAYTALHPNGFALHNFVLYRGINVLTPPTVTSEPVGAGSFSPTGNAATLLNGCSVAGFSENLYVYALATDGLSRLSGYDAGKVRAFVLSPESEEE